jgi:hypothetical protein
MRSGGRVKRSRLSIVTLPELGLTRRKRVVINEDLPLCFVSLDGWVEDETGHCVPGTD